MGPGSSCEDPGILSTRETFLRTKAMSPLRALVGCIADVDRGLGTDYARKIALSVDGGMIIAAVWTPDGERKLGAFDVDADTVSSARDIYDRAVIALQPRVTANGGLVEVQIPQADGSVETMQRRLRTPPRLLSAAENQIQAAVFMDSQEKVVVMVAEDTPVSYNGFRMLIKADTPTSVPKPIADLINDSRSQTIKNRRGVMMCLTCGTPAPCRCMYNPGVVARRPMAEREAIVGG